MSLLMSRLASCHAWLNDLPLFHSLKKFLP